MRTSVRFLIFLTPLAACGCTGSSVIHSIRLSNTYKAEFRVCFPSTAFERIELAYEFVAPGASIVSGSLWTPDGTVEKADILRGSALIFQSGSHYFLIRTKSQPTVSWEIKIPMVHIETDWSEWLDPSGQYSPENASYSLVVGAAGNAAQPLDYVPMMRYRIKGYRFDDSSEGDPPTLPCPKARYAR